jgi:hypothetical protein
MEMMFASGDEIDWQDELNELNESNDWVVWYTKLKFATESSLAIVV